MSYSYWLRMAYTSVLADMSLFLEL